jgi:inner membrane protein
LELSGAWPDPDFSGAFLPATRTIEDGGFKARWQVLGFNRSLPQRFWLDASPARELEASAFGVKLYRANDIYQQNARAGKYGVLISALVFWRCSCSRPSRG